MSERDATGAGPARFPQDPASGSPGKLQKSQDTKNIPKSRKVCPWKIFGAKSRPGRPQGAPWDLPGNPFDGFVAEAVAARGDLGPQEKRTSVPKRFFEYRRALGPSKNGFWKGVREKHDNLMKKQCVNRLHPVTKYTGVPNVKNQREKKIYT